MPEITPAVEPAPAAAAAAVDPAVDWQRQIDDLKEQVAEGQRTSQYWADKAKTGAPAAAAAPAEEEDDVLEAITTGGAKGFDALAKKRGFIKTIEVEALIDSKASALTKEQELMSEFPDLKNKKSDFFKDTAVAYGALIKQGTPPVVAMELAAQQTELAHMRSGKIKLPGAAPTPAEKEATRLKRVAAQAGAGSGARPSAAAEDDDLELTPEQAHIADAMGISHEAYAKRAKAGVSMKGLK
jgi:hypothetical protein